MAEPQVPTFLRLNPQSHKLPTEILADILSRLSPKTLLRFKCVSKEFYSLISSTHFINLHLKRALQNHSNSLLILSTSLSLFSIDLDDNPVRRIHHQNIPRNPTRRENPKVVGTCNGLLCIKDWGTIFIYNPTTQKCCFRIPDHLAECFGFGYDSVSDDYKVLAMDLPSSPSSSSSLPKFSGDICNGVRVFSLRRKSWEVGPSFCYVLAGNEKHAKFSNNALHWLVQDVGSDSGKSIVGFELHSESYSLLPLPELGEREKYEEVGLLVLGVDLCLQVEYLYEGSYALDVWAMKEYGVQQSWTKLFKFPYQDVIGSQISMKALAYSKGGRKVLLEQDSNYYWYQFEGLTLSANLGVSNCFAAAVCAGSLVSLADFQ